VFVSSTLQELAAERAATRAAIEAQGLIPVMFELGARPHRARSLYRAYLAQNHLFVGLHFERYGWVAPGEDVSGLEDEYLLSAGLPRLVHLKAPAPDREDGRASLGAARCQVRADRRPGAVRLRTGAFDDAFAEGRTLDPRSGAAHCRALLSRC
jgi:Domain of unknown function (DUF4062)